MIERCEQRAHRFFIGGLSGGEAGAIDAVINVRVDDVIDAVDVAAQFGRVVIGVHVREFLERGIQHSDDFGGFVVDDGAPLFVPQHGHRHATGIMRIGKKIDLGQSRFAVGGVECGARPRSEFPARIA